MTKETKTAWIACAVVTVSFCVIRLVLHFAFGI